MNSVIEAMLAKYNPKNNEERENAIKEIIQEIALAGLSRGGFFKKAAFYGGTCLRIFHGLNRFSEDLDFALLEKDSNFKIEDYFSALKKEFESYGIDMIIEAKNKNENNNVQSAFLNGNTLMLMMSFFPKSEDAKNVVSNQKIKIKFEVDTDNPIGGIAEYKYKMLPAPYEVQIFDEATLFSGKIHAILCRSYKNHVKGRDYYDYLFYIGKGSKFNLKYLENKLKNTGGIIDNDETLTLDKVKELLKTKFESIDYESAKADVSNFIIDKESLKIWKKELFISTLNELSPVNSVDIIRECFSLSFPENIKRIIDNKHIDKYDINAVLLDCFDGDKVYLTNNKLLEDGENSLNLYKIKQKYVKMIVPGLSDYRDHFEPGYVEYIDINTYISNNLIECEYILIKSSDDKCLIELRKRNVN